MRCCDVNAFLHSGKFIDYMGRTLAADEIEIKSMLLLRRDLYFNENARGSRAIVSQFSADIANSKLDWLREGKNSLM